MLSADTARTPPECAECVLLGGEGSQPHHHTFPLSLSGLGFLFFAVVGGFFFFFLFVLLLV